MSLRTKAAENVGVFLRAYPFPFQEGSDEHERTLDMFWLDLKGLPPEIPVGSDVVCIFANRDGEWFQPCICSMALVVFPPDKEFDEDGETCYYTSRTLWYGDQRVIWIVRDMISETAMGGERHGKRANPDYLTSDDFYCIMGRREGFTVFTLPGWLEGHERRMKEWRESKDESGEIIARMLATGTIYI